MHVAKITELFICTDNVKSMGMSWKHRCESIYISGLHTLPLNWARQLCSSHDWSVQLNRKSIILFRLSRHTELKMKVWPWGAHRELGTQHLLSGEQWGAGAVGLRLELGADVWSSLVSSAEELGSGDALPAGFQQAFPSCTHAAEVVLQAGLDLVPVWAQHPWGICSRSPQPQYSCGCSALLKIIPQPCPYVASSIKPGIIISHVSLVMPWSSISFKVHYHHLG